MNDNIVPINVITVNDKSTYAMLNRISYRSAYVMIINQTFH